MTTARRTPHQPVQPRGPKPRKSARGHLKARGDVRGTAARGLGFPDEARAAEKGKKVTRSYVLLFC